MSATAVKFRREEGHLPGEVSERPRMALSLRHAGCLPDHWLGTRDLPIDDADRMAPANWPALVKNPGEVMIPAIPCFRHRRRSAVRRSGRLPDRPAFHVRDCPH